MKLGNLTRVNAPEYMEMITQLLSGAGANNPFSKVRALDPSMQNVPSDVKAPDPVFAKFPTKSKGNKRSDADLAKDIRKLARRVYAKDRDREEYMRLRFEFVSSASPDREKIFYDNKKLLGGKINAALSYFTPDNQPILSFHPQIGWHFFPTDAERARGREFNDIYNGEMDRMIRKYGPVSSKELSDEQYQKIEQDAAAYEENLAIRENRPTAVDIKI